MKAKEFLEKQNFSYDHFTKLTSTGIEHDVSRICEFAESYHQHRVDSISDEEIETEMKNYKPEMTTSTSCDCSGYFGMGAEWLKQKLTEK